MTRFRVAWLAEITGRGTAIAGKIVDGSVHVGHHVVGPPSVPGVPLTIAGVEVADRRSTGESWIGLVVPPPPSGPEPTALKDALTAGLVLEIESSAPETGAHRDPPHNVR